VERTNEVGVRMALGASRSAVTTLLLRQGLKLALVGTLAGLAVAVSVSWSLSKLLYRVSPTDPITFGYLVVPLLTVAGVACWIPSRRAAQVDPMLILQQD
jgi:ABC-type lipoprotein release transport system permease subunit